jgi:hypothetical protein
MPTDQMKIKINMDDIHDLLENPHRIIENVAEIIQGETDFKMMGVVLLSMQEVMKKTVFNSDLEKVYVSF